MTKFISLYKIMASFFSMPSGINIYMDIVFGEGGILENTNMGQNL